jgi:SAM-dependent methyltransferase
MNREDPTQVLRRQLGELPYFRAMLRTVETCFYQSYPLPGPVLDIGAGDGHFAQVTFERPLDVGLEPFAPSIREAAGRNCYRLLAQADGGKMPFGDNSFGSAISNSVLEHIPHVRQVLAETCRVLKPGGLFLFCVPNPAYLSELSMPSILSRVGLRGLGERYREWFRVMSRVHHAETPEVWQGWLEAAGFRLEKWWHYFSPQAMRVLEWGHYFGGPSLVARKLTGRWILAPARWNLAITEQVVRNHARPVEDPRGTFTFFVARKPE